MDFIKIFKLIKKLSASHRKISSSYSKNLNKIQVTNLIENEQKLSFLQVMRLMTWILLKSANFVLCLHWIDYWTSYFVILFQKCVLSASASYSMICINSKSPTSSKNEPYLSFFLDDEVNDLDYLEIIELLKKLASPHHIQVTNLIKNERKFGFYWWWG